MSVYIRQERVERECVCDSMSTFSAEYLSPSELESSSDLATNVYCLVRVNVCVCVCWLWMCQLRSGCLSARCVHVTAAQDVFPALFLLDWLTYRVPQSCHMTELAGHMGPCDGAAQMRRHAAFCPPLRSPLIIAWLLNYCPTDMLPTRVSLFDFSTLSFLPSTGL